MMMSLGMDFFLKYQGFKVLHDSSYKEFLCIHNYNCYKKKELFTLCNTEYFPTIKKIYNFEHIWLEWRKKFSVNTLELKSSEAFKNSSCVGSTPRPIRLDLWEVWSG